MSDSAATDGSARWKPGTSILYQEVWAEELLLARPVTVVADDDHSLALYSHPETVFRSAAIGTARYQLPLEERIAAMVSSEPRTYEQRTAADAHVLVLAAEGRWSAVWLFWRADWTHLRWYVNLEQPIRRTPRSIQVRDCALDLVVHPNRSWEWKDRAEFDALCRCGFFPPHVASGVEAEARRMIDVIERWGSPFCDGWEQWRADPQLARPALPPDWRALER